MVSYKFSPYLQNVQIFNISTNLLKFTSLEKMAIVTVLQMQEKILP